MSTRHKTQQSYSHLCRDMGGWYRISWIVDRYIQGSRLRYPTKYERDTDEAGARRFCRKWDVSITELRARERK